MKRLLRLLPALVAVAMFAIAYASGDGTCDVHTSCPNAEYDLNGRICSGTDAQGTFGGVIVVRESEDRSTENHCVLYHKGCTPTGVNCNRLEEWDAAWHKIECVNANDSRRSFRGWCLDRVLKASALDVNCAGKKCNIPRAITDPPTPVPNPDPVPTQ